MTERNTLNRVWYTINWSVCFAFAKLWFHLHASGKTNVPRTGPVMLVSNHQSHLDPVLIGVACQRQLRFLARETLFRGPFGWLIRSLGSVPIDRDGAGIAGIK